MTGSVQSMSKTTRYVVFFIALGCIALQVGQRIELAAASAAIWIITLLFTDRVSLRRLYMPKFWGITIVIALSSGLFLGTRDIDLWGLRLSKQGLEAGILMVFRGVFLFALVGWGSRALRGSGISKVARRVGLGNLVLALSAAFEVLPALRDQFREHPIFASEGSKWRRLLMARHLIQDALRETAGLSDKLTAVLSNKAHAALIIVTADKGAGKTTSLINLSNELKKLDVVVGGIVQPALEKDGQRTGYELLSIRDGERTSFATKKQTQRGYDFDDRGWMWSGKRLEWAQQHADVVMIDELGILEAQGEGHMKTLLELAQHPGRAAVLVASVRQICVEEITVMLGSPAVVLDAPMKTEEIEKTALDIKAMIKTIRAGT